MTGLFARLRRTVQAARRALAERALRSPEEEVFTLEYFRMVERTSAPGIATMADSIVRDLRPRRLVDVGCGPGVFLASLRDRGVEVHGLDASAVARRLCAERGLRVVRCDLERDRLPSLADADTALCLEVGNLIAEAAADRCVAMLCTVGRAVVFSAGPPGQGGDRVRNEQPPEYWIAKFERHGFAHREELSAAWRARWKASGTAVWFSGNVMVFARRAAAPH